MTATLTSPITPPADTSPITDDRLTTPALPTANARPARAALALSTLLTGLFAGFFFTYSASVVLGFARVDDVTYVRSFQAINDTIRNPAFAVVFFGAVPITALALALHRADRTTRVALAFGLACTVAVVAITFLGSVPLNNELATYTDIDTTSAAVARDDFESTWNLLNLVRTLVSIAGAASVAIAATAARRLRH